MTQATIELAGEGTTIVHCPRPRNALTVAGLCYIIKQVVHFSNGGGICGGRDARSREQVMLTA
jgi:hypothetical protein